MSITMTVQAEALAPLQSTELSLEPLQLHLQASKSIVTRELNALLQQMRLSQLFTAEQIVQLADWEKEFFSDYLGDLSGDEERELVSMALCYLLESIILETCDRYPEDALRQRELFYFENATKEILRLTLPSGCEVNAFIEEYGLDDEEELLLNAQMALIDTYFQEQLAELSAAACEYDSQLIMHYHALCDRLKLITTEKKAAGESAITVIDELSTKIEGLYASLKQQEKPLSEVLKKLTEHSVATKKNYHHCETVIQRGMQA